MSDDVLIRVEGAAKKFSHGLASSLRYGARDLLAEITPWRSASGALRPDEFWAVRDVSFELRRHDRLALIGPNGAGKSTLLRLLMGRPKLTEGRIEIYGKVAAITELGAGFNPVQTGRENIYNSGSSLGLGEEEIESLVDDIIAFSELSEFMEMPVQSYSSGMRARLGFAIAVHLAPEVLLIDEALAVGDLGFKRKCIARLQRFAESGGSLIAVSHDLYSLQTICNRSLLLDRGRAVFEGSAVEGINRYLSMFREDGTAIAPGGSPGLEGRGARPEPSAATAADGRDPAPAPRTEDPIRIESLTMEPLDGGALKTGEPARVVLRYVASAPMESGFLWGFGISTADQLTSVASPIRLSENPAYRIERGAGELTCLIPRLPLTPGQWALRASIVDARTMRSLARLGHDDPPAVFRVGGSIDELSNIRAMRGDLIVMDVLWAGDPGFTP